jgi:hypothetical protein
MLCGEIPTTFGWNETPEPVPMRMEFADDAGATSTSVAELIPAVEAVTVIVRVVLSPAVLSVATAWPLLSVTPRVTSKPPEFAVNDTGTPGNSKLLASRAIATIVASADPSEGMEVELVTSVSAATVVVEAAVPTAMVTVDVNPAACAVTVMLRGVLFPPVERIARATPSLPVTTEPKLNAPDDADSVTGIPDTATLLLSRMSARTSAVLDPFAGMDAILEVSAIEAGEAPDEAAPTVMTVVEFNEPADADTVMFRRVLSPPVATVT